MLYKLLFIFLFYFLTFVQLEASSEDNNVREKRHILYNYPIGAPYYQLQRPIRPIFIRPAASYEKNCVTLDGFTRGTCKRILDCYPTIIKPPQDNKTELNELAIIYSENLGFCDQLLVTEVDNMNMEKKYVDVHSSTVCCPYKNPYQLPPFPNLRRSPGRNSPNCGKQVNYADDDQNRIIDGMISSDGQFPFMVALMRNSNGQRRQFCGGSLITERHVLTAAHCFHNTPPDAMRSMVLVMGTLDIYTGPSSGETTRGVVQIQTHAGFNMQHLQNDVAILTMDRPVTLNSKIQTICMSTKTPGKGSPTQVSGWGKIGPESNSPQSRKLRYTNVVTGSNAECQIEMRKAMGSAAPAIVPSMICATRPNYRDICQGDSGGPLFERKKDGRFEQIGIVSWGSSRCGDTSGVYTRLDYFGQWVSERTMN